MSALTVHNYDPKVVMPHHPTPSHHPIQQDDWDGAYSQKWNSNRRHCDMIYKDQSYFPDIHQHDRRRPKKQVEHREHGTEMPDKYSIRVNR